MNSQVDSLTENDIVFGSQPEDTQAHLSGANITDDIEGQTKNDYMDNLFFEYLYKQEDSDSEEDDPLLYFSDSLSSASQDDSEYEESSDLPSDDDGDSSNSSSASKRVLRSTSKTRTQVA